MNKRLILILHILSWTLIFVAGFSVYTQFVDPDTAIGRTAVNIGFLTLLFYLNFYLVNRYYELNKKKLYFLLSSILVLLIIAIRTAFNFWFAKFSDTVVIPEKPIIFITVTCLTTIIMFVLSSLLAIVQNRNRAEKMHLEQLNQLQLSQLKFLKAQINPHFLFNSLNNIYSLSLSKSDKAPEMLIKLSELLRYAIYQSHDSRVDLQREIEQVIRYIELFQLKSRSPLPVKITLNADDVNCQIPPMILITLVENSFKHGDISENPDTICEFHLEVKNGTLNFSTVNSFNPQMQKDQTRGIGLRNLEDTLGILYPGKFILNYNSVDRLFKVTLSIDYGD